MNSKQNAKHCLSIGAVLRIIINQMVGLARNKSPLFIHKKDVVSTRENHKEQETSHTSHGYGRAANKGIMTKRFVCHFVASSLYFKILH